MKNTIARISLNKVVFIIKRFITKIFYRKEYTNGII